jgi:hypothetical protein
LSVILRGVTQLIYFMTVSYETCIARHTWGANLFSKGFIVVGCRAIRCSRRAPVRMWALTPTLHLGAQAQSCDLTSRFYSTRVCKKVCRLHIVRVSTLVRKRAQSVTC